MFKKQYFCFSEEDIIKNEIIERKQRIINNPYEEILITNRVYHRKNIIKFYIQLIYKENKEGKYMENLSVIYNLDDYKRIKKVLTNGEIKKMILREINIEI